MIRDLLVLVLVLASAPFANADLRPGQSYSDRELYMNKQLHAQHPRFQALARDVKAEKIRELKKSRDLHTTAKKTRGHSCTACDEEKARSERLARAPASYRPVLKKAPVKKEPFRVSSELDAIPDFKLAQEAPPAKPGTPADLSDAELQQAIGQNPQTGAVKNEMSSSFNFDIDSFFAWVHQADAVKLGLSMTVFALDQAKKWRVNGDVADNLVGVSLNRTFVPGIRLALGVGYGRLLGDTADDIEAKGKSKNTAYFKGSIRLW